MDPAPNECDDRGSGFMSASITRLVSQPQRFGRLWWLPPGGLGNGINDDAWAQILQVSADLVSPLLEELRIAGVPAYAARMSSASSRRPVSAAASSCRLWVGTSAYARAEETLITVLPSLISRPQHDVGTRP
jgi:hypothetical protein